MKTHSDRQVAVLLVAFCIIGSVAWASQVSRQPVDDATLAAMIMKGAERDRVAAVAVIAKIPVGRRSPLLLSAVLEELERVRREIEDRGIALREGRPLPPVADHGEYLFSLLDVVTQHTSDPAIIPALIPFVGTGNRVMNALAEFGDLAVLDLAAVAESPLSSSVDPGAAMATLQRMLLRPTHRPLNQRSKELIVRMVGRRLDTASKLGVLLNAVDLAAATDDPGLLSRVRAIARDPAARRTPGTYQAADIGRLRARATAAAAKADERAQNR